MDFGTLLSVAQKNSTNKQTVSYYPTKFAPPKKESKQTKTLSENIKKFLARKEEEEKQKALEEKQKRDNLLALRDHKAQSRINKHLKVCKAANKSVIADAVNNVDTAVTIAGSSQPDEDDYGYVSQEASAFYNQLMKKYNKLPPEKPLFSESGKKVVKDIALTKDRVRQALKQQEIEDSLPHRRKRKLSEVTGKDNERDCSRDKSSNEGNKFAEKDDKQQVKKRPTIPPPLDFVSLLKLAEKKQHEPIMVEVKPKIEDSERPMTKKQKEEYLKLKEWKDKMVRGRNGEIPKASAVNPANEAAKVPKSVPNKIPKLTHAKSTTNTLAEKSLSKSNSSSVKKISERPVDKVISKLSVKDEILEERRKLEAEKRELESMRRMIEEEKKKLAIQVKNKKSEERSSPSVNTNKVVSSNGKVEKQLVYLKDTKLHQIPPTNSKLRQLPPADVKPRQFPPADVKPRQIPPAYNKSKHFPPKSAKNTINERSISQSKGQIKPKKQSIYYDDDEEEYDSDLADFIDDTPIDETDDYSQYISEIFRYDRDDYYSSDDDDVNMESNFAQQLKEEYVSTKIGIMEDLEDIRQEALEKKRKALMAKKSKKK